MKRIKVLGIGGQGIAFSGWLLGYAATSSGLFSAVHHSYGAEVRGGSVISNIMIDGKPIVNPYTDKFDYYLVLHSIGWRYVGMEKNAVIIADDVVAGKDFPENIKIDWKPFDKIGHEKSLPVNVIALGYLSKKGIISYEALEKAIISRGKDVEHNLKALEIGYKL